MICVALWNVVAALCVGTVGGKQSCLLHPVACGDEGASCVSRSLTSPPASRFPNVSAKGRGYQIRALANGVEGWEELRKVAVWQTAAALQLEMETKMIKARIDVGNKNSPKYVSPQMAARRVHVRTHFLP